MKIYLKKVNIMTKCTGCGKELEDNKKYTDNGELESHTITIKFKLNGSNLSDAVYAVACANEFYCDKENKPVEYSEVRIKADMYKHKIYLHNDNISNNPS